ncbi:MAG: TonB-dependent receptor, partial [Calditrichaceae bacterium]
IGANVYIDGAMYGSSTNQDGYYVIPKMPAGTYTLVVDYLGYKQSLNEIIIKKGERTKLDIYLDEDILQTETIVIVADSIPTIEKLYNKPISEIHLNAKQIQQIPQAVEADLMRSLQTLPGIVPVSDFSSELYVRGGTADQNLYLLDGADVYNPDHAFGFFSTFNTDAIKQVNVSKGGFGAEYGGRLSSVVDVTNLDGNREEFEGSVAISLLSAKTTLQMPIGQFGSISGSIRRTYFDKTIANYIDDVPDYYFYDGNIKAFFDINAHNKLSLSGFGGRDYLDFVFNEDAEEKVGFTYDWGNKTGSIKWTHIFSPTLFSNFWITNSRFSSYFDLDEFNVSEDNIVMDFTVKGNLEYHYSNKISAQFGFEQKYLRINYEQEFPGGEVDAKAAPEHYATYVQSNWRPNRRWDIETGIRYNYFDADTSYQNFSPRLSAKYRLTDKINLKAAAGIYYQYLHRVPRFITSDIWTNSNSFQKPSRSIHYILGYQQEIRKDYQFETEAYYKEFDNVYSFNNNFLTELTTDRFNSDNEPVYDVIKGLFNTGKGNSYGLELMIRKDVGFVTGWVGYSLSKTKYTIEAINGGREFSPRHDRTSMLNFVSTFNLSGKPKDIYKGTWHVGLNLVYSSGQPYTEPGSGYIIGSTPNAPERYVEYAPTSINNIRFPDYARMDVSLIYRKKFRPFALETYIQIYNIGNRRNVWFVNYEYENGKPDAKEVTMLPLLPTLGLNIKF